MSAVGARARRRSGRCGGTGTPSLAGPSAGAVATLLGSGGILGSSATVNLLQRRARRPVPFSQCTTGGEGTRTTIVLDDQLVQEAHTLSGLRTKREVVDLALRQMVAPTDASHGLPRRR